MVKGEELMPVPEGIISTSTGPSEPVLDEALVEADAEEAVEEYDLPELS